MKKPKMSVIMSVYDGERYLAESIESILNQTFSDLEFIIIDDGSIGNSLNIIKEYQRKDSRIKIIINKTNIGLTKSLNRGIKLAQGRYIARQDTDDVSLPQRLAKQYSFLEKNKDILLCGTNFDYIDERGNVLQRKSDIFPTSFNSLKKILPTKNCLIHASITFRNNDIYYRDKFYYAQDYDLYLNIISQKCKISNLPNKLVLYRLDPDAISVTHKTSQKKFSEIARKFYRQRMQKGIDKYKFLNKDKILAERNEKSAKKIAIEDKIKFYLKNKEYKKAREVYYKDYLKTPGTKSLDRYLFSLFVNFPLFYKTYRLLRYQN
ncbi:MAG: glycosyltransferase [Parcubacteria group bacterium]|nr:glycosyltransferase [Parcubacteria group bacterium]